MSHCEYLNPMVQHVIFRNRCIEPGCNIKKHGKNKQCRKHLYNLDEKQYLISEAMTNVRCSTHIYFILGIGTDKVKIGKTRDLKSRLSGMQTGSPVKLVLVSYYMAMDSEERFLHDALKKYKANGEWFYLSDEIIDIIDVTRDKLAPDIKERVREVLNKYADIDKRTL